MYNTFRIPEPKKYCRLPLLCWDRYAQSMLEIPEKINKQRDFTALQMFQKQFSWIFPPEEIIQTPYQALILTDQQQKIIWVNKGFQSMTGYAPSFAVGKNPSFLQGPKTDTGFRSTVKKSVVEGKYYFGNVINYRKNQEEYWCEVSILPLYNVEHALTHFIALEREIRI